MEIRTLDDADRPWFGDLIAREWGFPVVSISGLLDPMALPGFVAEADGERVGVVTYRLADGECEVATLNALRPRQGIGTALMAAVKEVADREQVRLWLMTTNENVGAIAFYERIGMDLRAMHRDFVDEVRRHKPTLDAPGFHDALEFSF